MSKILLVEDAPDNAQMIARLMRLRGYEVVIATDGRSAVEMADAEQPDAVVMDLVLEGGMSGLDATRLIKAAPKTQSLPVIILSASTLASFRSEALEAGADDVDTKPVEFDRLTGKIESLLN